MSQHRMSFGLRNLSQTLEKFVDEVFNGLNFVFVYIDNILIASDNEEKLLQHLRIVFHHLVYCDLNIKFKKFIDILCNISIKRIKPAI